MTYLFYLNCELISFGCYTKYPIMNKKPIEKKAPKFTYLYCDEKKNHVFLLNLVSVLFSVYELLMKKKRYMYFNFHIQLNYLLRKTGIY